MNNVPVIVASREKQDKAGSTWLVVVSKSFQRGSANDYILMCLRFVEGRFVQTSEISSYLLQTDVFA